MKAASIKSLPVGVYLARELRFSQDFSQGPSERARIAELRTRLQAAIPDGDRYKPGTAVYFRLGHGGVARLIENEDELMRALSARGFEIFDLEGASVSEIRQRFRHARTVVRIEGSQQCHLTFALPEGSVLISLMPSNRFTMVLLAYARAIGLQWGCVVFDRAAHGYHVDVGDVLRTLDLAEQKREDGHRVPGKSRRRHRIDPDINCWRPIGPTVCKATTACGMLTSVQRPHFGPSSEPTASSTPKGLK